jgi:hypothetical protein
VSAGGRGISISTTAIGRIALVCDRHGLVETFERGVDLDELWRAGLAHRVETHTVDVPLQGGVDRARSLDLFRVGFDSVIGPPAPKRSTSSTIGGES